MTSCDCEHRAHLTGAGHPYRERKEGVVRVRTPYGKLKLCSGCRRAGHMGAPFVKRNPTYKRHGHGYRGESAEFRHMTLEEGKMLTYGAHIWFLANDGSARMVKVNGAVKRWKREPDRIEVPVKYGMYEHATFHARDFGPNGRALMEL